MLGTARKQEGFLKQHNTRLTEKQYSCLKGKHKPH